MNYKKVQQLIFASACICICLILSTHNVNAVLYAYDGFALSDYTTAGIGGQNPSISGFSGAWSGNGSIFDNSLVYSQLHTEGYDYRRNNGAAVRYLDTTASGPFATLRDASGTALGANTLYCSFLMTAPNAMYSGFLELQNSGSRACRFGINDGVWSRRIGGENWYTISGAPAVVAGSVNLVVFSVDFNAGDTRQYYKVWINPSLLGGTEPTPTYSFESTSVISVDSVMMGLYFSADAEIDELRFGETYADVTPQSTQPYDGLAAYESFSDTDYSLGGLNGQNPYVVGFSNAWSGNGSLVVNSLQYAQIATEGYMYQRTDGGASRLFDISSSGPFESFLNTAQTDIGSNTLYTSFLMTSPNTTGSGYVELQDNTTRAFRIGINTGVWSYRIGVDAWTTITGTPAVSSGATNLIVFSIDFNEGGGQQHYKVWINPTSLAGEEPTATYSFDSSTLIVVDSVLLGLYFGEAAEIDELRFGTSYAHVTPIVDNDEGAPAGAGWVDVTLYGAIPDDGNDDTAAIQMAINEKIGNRTSIRTLYFPNGEYTISDTLVWKNSSDEWKAYLRLRGQNRERTILRLTDSTFTDSTTPQAMIYTASSGTTTDGSGNTAFANYIEDMTLHTGNNNPGAVAVNYIASNVGAVRRVNIISGDSAGAAGIMMNRNFAGPAMIDDVSIEGYDYGIDFRDQNKYSMTCKDVELSEQTIAGIRNNKNAVNFINLHSNNSVPVMTGDDEIAFTVFLNSVFEGGNASAYAVIFKGGLVMRNCTVDGYRSAPVRNNNNGTDAGSSYISEYISHPVVSQFPDSAGSTMGLPIEHPPVIPHDPQTNWVKVSAYSSAGIQSAIDTAAAADKSTVYFPIGQYNLTTPVTIHGSVSHIIGNNAFINWSPSTYYPAAFVLDGLTSESLCIEQFLFSDWAASYSGYTFIMDKTTVPLTFRDIMQTLKDGVPYRHTLPKKIFFENCAMSDLVFSNAQVWAWQLDPEGKDTTKINNINSALWIFGLKTEWSSTSVATYNGGLTEVLGAMFYVPFDYKSYTIPAVLNDNSQLSLSMTCYGDYNDIFVRGIHETSTSDYTYSDSLGAGHPRTGRTIPLYTSPIPEPCMLFGLALLILLVRRVLQK